MLVVVVWRCLLHAGCCLWVAVCCSLFPGFVSCLLVVVCWCSLFDVCWLLLDVCCLRCVLC